MTLVMAGRPPQSSHILQTATDLNWNLPFPGGKRRVDCLSPSVYAASSLDVCGPRRGGEDTEIVDSIVGKFDRITADDGFHGREGGRKTKIFRVRIRLIYGGRGRYTHRCPAKYRFFDIPDILDTPANIADRRWHSIAPNLSRLSYTSTDFFLN